ncbi:MAG: helix-turn-helix transcriptional regulator [Porticoccaceae bacterium]|jgi:DNA-binding CsgD family transcriptional regulator|nr:helix-turn-helix transcriptional regulator [Porticoccaceae bacterium]MDG1446443.1 helix-turn-helix transcriptional regulator [Porticoccaceae bacterium]
MGLDKHAAGVSALSRSDLPEMLDSVQINSMADINDAAVALQAIGQEYGLKLALCDDISSREPLVDADGVVLNADVFGWVQDTERWWEENSLALSSPMVRACRYENEPFWCNSDGFYGHAHNPYIEKIDLKAYFGEANRFQSAVLIPIHLPFGQISANSIHSLDPENKNLAKEYELYADFFALLIRRFISGYVAAKRTTRRIPSDFILSRREVECLHWAAIGKTDKEIGMIIDLSHATIRYHMQRAGEKLNAVNRAQTTFKAGQLGFLGAND